MLSFRCSLPSPVNLLPARVGSSPRPCPRRGVGLGQAPGAIGALARVTPASPPPDSLGVTALRAGGGRCKDPVQAAGTDTDPSAVLADAGVLRSRTLINADLDGGAHRSRWLPLLHINFAGQQ